MTIAIEATGPSIGAKMFAPDGPMANLTPGLFAFKPGQVIRGDAGSAYIYLMFTAVSSTTLQQGMLIAWDNSFQAYLPTTALANHGDAYGTVFFGMRFGDPGGRPSFNNWPNQYTIPAGNYGIWAQFRGCTSLLLRPAAVTAPAAANVVTTSTVAGFADAPTTAVGALLLGCTLSPFAPTFVADTTAGSNILSNLVSAHGMTIGDTFTGTGFAGASLGAVIGQINGSSVTVFNNVSGQSANATASNTGVTFTVTKYAMTANTVNGSPIL